LTGLLCSCQLAKWSSSSFCLKLKFVSPSPNSLHPPSIFATKDWPSLNEVVKRFGFRPKTGRGREAPFWLLIAFGSTSFYTSPLHSLSLFHFIGLSVQTEDLLLNDDAAPIEVKTAALRMNINKYKE